MTQFVDNCKFEIIDTHRQGALFKKIKTACAFDIGLYWAVKMLIFFGYLGWNNKQAQK